jgi:hypothetical protein
MERGFTAATACFVLLLLLFTFGVDAARGEGDKAGEEKAPAITRLHLEEEGGLLLLTAELAYRLDGQNREALEGGVPFSFRFHLRLSRDGGILGEKLVRDDSVTHTLLYDPLRKLYRFTGEGYPDKREQETADRGEALRLMGTVDRWPLTPVASLRGGARYRVRAMATLRSSELPSVWGYLLFFTTIFNQDTAWKETDFTWR